jgi:hypothetical protein
VSKYPNSGILRRNEDRKSDKHAHYRGSAEVAGQEYWLDAWINTPEDGKPPYMKLSFKPKEARTEAAPSRQTSIAADLDDAVPF